MRNQYKRAPFKKKKNKSNLLKHKMKGTDNERRIQALESRNEQCHSTKPLIGIQYQKETVLGLLHFL